MRNPSLVIPQPTDTNMILRNLIFKVSGETTWEWISHFLPHLIGHVITYLFEAYYGHTSTAAFGYRSITFKTNVISAMQSVKPIRLSDWYWQGSAICNTTIYVKVLIKLKAILNYSERDEGNLRCIYTRLMQPCTLRRPKQRSISQPIAWTFEYNSIV